MLLAQCADCRPKPERPLPGRAGLGQWFEARFRTECDGPCGGEIKPGDMIRSDGEGGWLCAECGGGSGEW